MKKHEIIRPIGLNALCMEIMNTCDNAKQYGPCGRIPNHLIIPLDSGNGRTTILEYMTRMYKSSGVMRFSSGRDDFIEVVFDGSPQQLKQAFSMIDSAAEYTNAYENIVGMDISGIAPHLGEVQWTDFQRSIARICKSACVVFFVKQEPSSAEERLLNRLQKTVKKVKRINFEPYTVEDYCDLVIKGLRSYGITVIGDKGVRSILHKVITNNITNVKEALEIADMLVQYADFSGFRPTINKTMMSLAYDELIMLEERRQAI